MPITVTSAQALALAPDESSAKAARLLASPKPWSGLGQNARFIWGACQGSGKDPYLTQADWEGPAFKCSCPSRKFPCKHGLALLLLLAEQPERFASSAEPDWVKAWMASRQQRAETKASKEPAPADEAVRSKRAEQRAGRVSGGIDLAELWLRDLMRQGLASAPGRGFDFWDQQAARLVDSQAPGLARLIRDLGAIAVSGDGWQQRMVRAVGRIALLLQAFRRVETLPPETRADVRSAIGFTVPQADVLASAPVRDEWLVAGQSIHQEDRLRVLRTWLHGERTGRDALVLDFATGSAGFKTTLVPGSLIDADICFFPGAAPLRALVREVLGSPRVPGGIPGNSIAEAYAALGDRSAMNPWVETQPVLLNAVTPVPAQGLWSVIDESGAAMPCLADLPMLALSGGRPIGLAGEWDGHALKPLTVVAGGRFAPLRQAASA